MSELHFCSFAHKNRWANSQPWEILENLILVQKAIGPYFKKISGNQILNSIKHFKFNFLKLIVQYLYHKNIES